MVPTIPLAKRPIYQGLLGAIFGVSSVIGPLVGGAFTNNVSWRWCFYINLPIGAVSVLIILFILKVPVPEKAGTTFVAQVKALDPYGTAVFLPAVVSLILALQWGGTEYAWNSARIIALLVLFVVLFTAFIVIQVWQKDNATVPVRVLTQRSVACGVAFSACVGGAMIAFVYYMPIWFQAILGVSAYQSGINVLPFILALVVGSIFAGALVTNLGYYTPFLILSSCVMAVGTGLITTFQVDTPSHTWIGYLIIFGLGMGLGMQQPSLAAQVCLSKKDVPIGASLMFFSQSLGGAIFLCVAQNVFTNKLVSGLSDVAGLDASTVVNMGATDLASFIPANLLPIVLIAYNKALTTTFYVPVAIASISIFAGLCMEWKSVKGRKRGQMGKEEEPKASA
jgi:Major Facilitator Superfamily